MDGHAWRLGVLAGHGAEQSRARTTYGGDSMAAGRGSTTTAAHAGAAETTRSIVDQKVEDEPVDIYRPGPFSPGW